MKQSEAATHGRRAVIELREKILSGELQGGTRLFEVPLAEALDISRTPVREAMSRLTEEGLLDRLPNGGFVVRRFGFADVVDSIEVRGVMEGMAARLAAERGAAPEALDEIKHTVIKLDACFGEQLDDVDFDAYSDLNEKFHHQLAALAGSEIIRREVDGRVRYPLPHPPPSCPTRLTLPPSAVRSDPRRTSTGRSSARSKHAKAAARKRSPGSMRARRDVILNTFWRRTQP